MGGYGMGFGWIFWLILIVIIVWAVIRYAGSGPGRSSGRIDAGSGGGRALEILKERYAKGEITKEEYDRMKRDLEHD
jgi:putative membrane protein